MGYAIVAITIEKVESKQKFEVVSKSSNKRKETLGEDKMGYKMALIFLGIVIIGCSKVEAKNVEFLDITSATDAANGQWCQVCQDFITKASFFLRENETRTQIIGALHDACFHLHSFKQKCILLVDYYTQLFFAEVDKLQPNLFCEKVKLCEDKPFVGIVKHDNPCTLCHNVVDEILTKLDDPDTQIETIRAILKVFNQLEDFANQCKKLVLEYGPIILAHTEKFFEKTDICAAIHACKAHKGAPVEQKFPLLLHELFQVLLHS
ncbi:hypothetical protein HPP92_011979 [Vanilla planifolia]|uniref:Saposin B-type domain-containing protein n=1 Tax=Vanilla planifolia TaxID=51239 RepID=A0A835V2W8_VANPL|nr:hypothetical protein HPP92_011979 [Vanilla planifolia]